MGITIFQLIAIHRWHLTFVKSASACRSSPAGILSHAPADTEGGSLLQSVFASVKLFRASSKPARSFCPSVRRFWTVSETSFKESLSSVSSVIYESEKVKVKYWRGPHNMFTVTKIGPHCVHTPYKCSFKIFSLIKMYVLVTSLCCLSFRIKFLH